MLSCKSCGGKLVFNVKTQKLVCDFCKSSFKVEDYDQETDVQESVTYDAIYYLCRNCGAEQTVTNDSLVCYCEYCGSEMMMRGRIKEEKPDGIVPFTVTRQRARDVYAEEIKGLWYVPKEYKDPERIGEFRGIYIPYFGFDAEIEGMPKATVTNTIGSTQYVYENTYSVYQKKGYYEQDASSKFNDSISNVISTSDSMEKVEPFREGYLAGFYADKADLDPGVYKEDIRNRVRSDMEKSIKGSISNWSDIKVNEKASTKVLLPVWFLTYRNKDRVAYIVENGRNGKISADVPVQKSLFLLASLGIAAVIFGILYVLMTTTAKVTMHLSLLLSAVVFMVFRSQLTRLRKRELREDDIGFQAMQGDENAVSKASKLRDSKTKGCLSFIASSVGTIIFFVVTGLYFLPELLDMLSELTLPTLPFISGILIVYCFIRSIGSALKVKRIGLVITCFLFLAAAIGGWAVSALGLVNDVYHYAVSLLTLAGTLVGALELIEMYNLQTTHPMPGFYDRKGGKHDDKE